MDNNCVFMNERTYFWFIEFNRDLTDIIIRSIALAISTQVSSILDQIRRNQSWENPKNRKNKLNKEAEIINRKIRVDFNYVFYFITFHLMKSNFFPANFTKTN